MCLASRFITYCGTSTILSLFIYFGILICILKDLLDPGASKPKS